jgi:hypothetical protein
MICLENPVEAIKSVFSRYSLEELKVPEGLDSRVMSCDLNWWSSEIRKFSYLPLKNQIARTLPLKDAYSYLGLPLTVRKPTKPELHSLVDKVADILLWWNASLMNRAGKLITVCGVHRHSYLPHDCYGLAWVGDKGHWQAVQGVSLEGPGEGQLRQLPCFLGMSSATNPVRQPWYS